MLLISLFYITSFICLGIIYLFFFFFLNYRAPPEFSPLSLPAPFPISSLVLPRTPAPVRAATLGRDAAVRTATLRRTLPSRRRPLPPGLRRALPTGRLRGRPPHALKDRKSTRLNSSHLVISYAVFCLKK